MIEDVDKHRASDEAAAWFSRLNGPRVTEEDLADFTAWREVAANARAFEKVDSFWRRAEALKSDPEFAAQTLAELRAARPRSRAPALAIAASVTLAVLAGGYYWFVGAGRISTDVGELRVVALDDGSRVHLDTHSAIRVDLSSAERRVVLLRGQAMFDVAKDASRPFIVKSGDLSVRALGTRFDVSRRAQGVKVILAEGAVEVRSGEQTWRLSPGQQIDTGPGRSVQRTSVDVGAETSWSEGVLTFRDRPLTEAVAEMNRYSKRKIRLADGAGDVGNVSGVFELGRSDAFVAAVTTSFALEAEQKPDGTIELSARDHSAASM
ncbi:FecR family protein [Caulobacter sp. 73W]|uniref:FecR family protein n=1 Tax=Caulobacter sp. 73W TaxID=3161137 RepID=A0AB39KWK5_9CAUL